MYAEGLDDRPSPVLAVPREIRTPMLVAACRAAGVALVSSAGEIVDLVWPA